MTAKKTAVTVTALVPVIDPGELSTKLTTISTQVKTLPLITSDDDYDTAYNIRAKIKSAIKWISSRTDPDIDAKHKSHKAAIAEKKKLVKPFDDLDDQLDSKMLEWSKKKKEIAAQLKLERDRDLVEISEAILLEDDITYDSEIKGFEITSFNSLLPAFIPDKPRGERTYKRIRIIDPNLFNPEFIQWFLSDEDVKDTIRKWLEKQAKLLGGFEPLLDLAGKGSIEQVEEESISIR